MSFSANKLRLCADLGIWFESQEIRTQWSSHVRTAGACRVCLQLYAIAREASHATHAAAVRTNTQPVAWDKLCSVSRLAVLKWHLSSQLVAICCFALTLARIHFSMLTFDWFQVAHRGNFEW
jgi:hypothetical protein